MDATGMAILGCQHPAPVGQQNGWGLEAHWFDKRDSKAMNPRRPKHLRVDGPGGGPAKEVGDFDFTRPEDALGKSSWSNAALSDVVSPASDR